MNLLPNDVIRSILYYVPLSELFSNVYRVCRQWHTILQDDRFWKDYHQLKTNPTRKSWLWFARCHVRHNIGNVGKFVLGRVELSYGSETDELPNGTQKWDGFLMLGETNQYRFVQNNGLK